jgi:polar amino acid transport system substrate-binding protein
MNTRSTIFAIAIGSLVMAGCAGGNQGRINSVSDLQGKVIGSISTGISEKTKLDQTTLLIGAEPKEILQFNNRSDILAALISGKIDGAGAPKSISEYYAKRNSKLKIIETKDHFETEIVMAVRNDDEKLKSELDSALTILQGNGKLKSLEDEWITNLPANNEPAFKAIPKIDGARTIYVGVSGDFAPLDYIASDGRPAGFNVAMLAEMGKVLNVNFEVVSIDSQAKFVALASKKIDIVFFQIMAKKYASLYTAESKKFLPTIPYYKDLSGYFLVRK